MEGIPKRSRRGSLNIVAYGMTETLPLNCDDEHTWLEEDELDHETWQLIANMAARGLDEVLSFCFAGRQLDKSSDMRRVARSLLAVTWLLRPDFLQNAVGERMSLDDLAAPARGSMLEVLAFAASAGFRRKVGVSFGISEVRD